MDVGYRIRVEVLFPFLLEVFKFQLLKLQMFDEFYRVCFSGPYDKYFVYNITKLNLSQILSLLQNKSGSYFHVRT